MNNPLNVQTNPNRMHANSGARSDVRSFLNKVYLWMTAGMVISGLSANAVLSHPALLMKIVGPWFLPLVLVQLACVFGLSFFSERLNATTATLVYGFYCLLTGATLSVIALVYTTQSITQVFLLTSGSFVGLSAYGYMTKRDLGPIGTFLVMGLFGLVGASLIALLVGGTHNQTYQLVSASIGVLIFAGLTAYDTQRLKKLYAMSISGGVATADSEQRLAIRGALTMYLNFINLFLSLLRLLGNRR